MMTQDGDPIIIIGAGIAGLSAARVLHDAGLPVVVLDKSRGVGGRMATRRIQNGRFDHGAQYFTARDPRFQQLVAQWQSLQVVVEWSRGFAQNSGHAEVYGHPRYRGVEGMTAVPKYLAAGLNVRLGQRVTAVERASNTWAVHLENDQIINGQRLVLTPPVPQSLAVLDAGAVTLPAADRRALETVAYNPCTAVMALLDGPSRLPEPGGIQFSIGPLAWMADNRQKGISPEGFGVTIHATPEFTRQTWDDDERLVAGKMLHAAADWLGGHVIEWQLMRWRFAQATSLYPDPVAIIPGQPPLLFAGDGFGGARIEGAALSGLAAAEIILNTLE